MGSERQRNLGPSEGVYRRAFEDAAQGLYIADAEWRFTAVNRAMAKILGFSSPGNLVAAHGSVDAIPYADEGRGHQIRRLLEQKSQLLGLESLVRRRNGTTVWVSETFHLVRGLGGRVTGLEGSMVEVTELKELEQALQRAVERLAALSHIEHSALTSATAGQIAATAVQVILSVIHYDVGFVVLFDQEISRANVIAAHGNRDYWPQEGTILPLQMLTEEWELAGPPVRHTEDIAAMSDRFPVLQQLARQGLRSVLRALLVAGGAPLGELVVASTEANCFSHEDLWAIQEAADALAIGLDKAKLHATLVAERELQQLALHALPTGVLLLDSAGHILVSNPAGYEFLPVLTSSGPGAPVAELGGRRLVDLASGTAAGRWTEIVVNAEKPRAFEVLVARRVLSGGSPGLVVAIQDVTKDRNVERQLRLQERLASIGQLATGIAHDFNNLLQGIEMDAERSLSRENMPDAALEAQAAIVNRTRRGASLIRQLLDSCSTSSNVRVRERISLRAVVEQDLALLKRTFPETIELTFNPGDEDVQIEGDPGQIQRAVANLAINARDAMPVGGRLQVEVGVFVLEEGSAPPAVGMSPGAWACLRVRDNGTGIAPAVQPHILEPFFTTKQPGYGTGLGLPQVFGIVTDHGGFMGFSSQPGEGSTFSLYFPLANTTAPPTAAPLERMDTVRRGNGESILVVEDDREVLALITEALEGLGYKAVGEVRGDRALALYAEDGHRFDLVITDLVIPGISGLELSSRLRALNPRARVLIMSGHSPREVPVPENSGVVGWMTKPFSIGVLGNVVGRALRGETASPVPGPAAGDGVAREL